MFWRTCFFKYRWISYGFFKKCVLERLSFKIHYAVTRNVFGLWRLDNGLLHGLLFDDLDQLYSAYWGIVLFNKDVFRHLTSSISSINFHALFIFKLLRRGILWGFPILVTGLSRFKAIVAPFQAQVLIWVCSWERRQWHFIHFFYH